MYSRRAYSTVCPSKLLHQGTFHGRPDSRCMLASQMFSVQLQLNWNIKTIAVLMLDPCSDLGKITDGNITPCILREDSSRNHPVFWSWPKHTKIFSVDTFMGVIVIFIASPACMQHAALLLSGAVIHICRPICYGWDSVSSVCLIVSMNLYISTYFITTSWVILWVSNQLVGFEYPFVVCVCMHVWGDPTPEGVWIGDSKALFLRHPQCFISQAWRKSSFIHSLHCFKCK